MNSLPWTPPFSSWEPGVFSLIVFCVIVIALMIVMLLLSSWLGVKRPGPEKNRAYESGIIPTGTARLRFPVSFYLVAIFFLIFDVEGAFIFSWAVACKPLGAVGWLGITFFITVLLLGLAYIWRRGGLYWGEK